MGMVGLCANTFIRMNTENMQLALMLNLAMEELEKELKELKGSVTSEEEQKYQPTRAPRF